VRNLIYYYKISPCGRNDITQIILTFLLLEKTMTLQINPDSKSTDLFTPLAIDSMTLRNRVVMAPLTRNRAGAGNVPTDMNVEYYRQRASAGLIITEATQISPQGVGYPLTPGIHTQEQVIGWKKVVDAVHKKGGKIFLQLWHVGRISHPSLQPNGELPVAPSAVKPGGQAVTYEGMQDFVMPRALDLNEIPGIINDYRLAARNAREAGFDGIEVHAANGYLLDQFLRDGPNKRTDKYGGSIENRARLIFEVLDEVIKEWPDFRTGLRLSPSGTFNDMSDSSTRETFGYVVKKLNEYKLAYLHIREPDESDLRHGGEIVPLEYFRKLYPGILMVNGGYDADKGNAVIRDGNADLVAYGVKFIANPDLPERLQKNTQLNEPDPATFYGGDEKGYTDYRALASAS
jgi:N-ethylmaleimide reductase